MVAPDETPRLRSYLRNWPIVLCHGIALWARSSSGFPGAWSAWRRFCTWCACAFCRPATTATSRTGASRPGARFQFVLALLGGMCTQRGALWWAANHRLHHAHRTSPATSTRRSATASTGATSAGSSRSATRPRASTASATSRATPSYAGSTDTLRAVAALPGALLLLGGWSAGIWGCFVSTVVAVARHLQHQLARARGSGVGATRPANESRNNSSSRSSRWARAGTTTIITISVGGQGFYWWEIDLPTTC